MPKKRGGGTLSTLQETRSGKAAEEGGPWLDLALSRGLLPLISKARSMAEKEYFRAKSGSSVDSSGTIPAEDIIYPENSGDIATQSWQKNSRELSGSSQYYRLIPESRLRSDKYIKFKRIWGGEKTGYIPLREWLDKVAPIAASGD